MTSRIGLLGSLSILIMVSFGMNAFADTKTFEPKFSVVYEQRPSEENGNWCKFRLAMAASSDQIAQVESVVFDVHPSMGRWRYAEAVADKSSATLLVSDDRDTNVPFWKTMGTRVTLKSGETLNFGPIQIECADTLLKAGDLDTYTVDVKSLAVDSSYVQSILTSVAGGCVISNSSDRWSVRFKNSMSLATFKRAVALQSNESLEVTAVNYEGKVALLSCGDAGPDGLKR